MLMEQEVNSLNQKYETMPIAVDKLCKIYKQREKCNDRNNHSISGSGCQVSFR